jgi:YD repeat-containing protein
MTGQLVAQITETARTTQLLTYDNLGRLTAQGLDFNGNGTLDPASSDRITTIDQAFANSSGWEDVTTVQRQLQDGADAPVLFQRSRKKEGH